MKNPHHLGDGAYVMHDGYYIWFAANDHRNPTVAIEPIGMLSLVDYLKTHTPDLYVAMKKRFNNE